MNDGSTTLENRLGAVADLELVIRSRKLEDDIMVVRYICFTREITGLLFTGVPLGSVVHLLFFTLQLF